LTANGQGPAPTISDPALSGTVQFERATTPEPNQFITGASTLIQSLWRVEDATTADLMRRFYVELGGGCPPGAALRSAQRALLEAGAQFFVWAPFQLLGSSGD